MCISLWNKLVPSTQQKKGLKKGERWGKEKKFQAFLKLKQYNQINFTENVFASLFF